MTVTVDRPAGDVATSAPSGRVTLEAWRLRAALDGAAVAAGTDDMLPGLMAVQLSTVGNVLQATGTDRYRLAIVSADSSDIVGSVDRLLMSLADVRKIVRALPKSAPARGLVPTAVLTVGEGRWEVEVDGSTFSGADLSGVLSFPKAEALVPDPAACVYFGPVRFTGAYLADIGRMPVPRGGKGGGVDYVGATGPNKPTLWQFAEASGIAWRYLLMPVRVA